MAGEHWLLSRLAELAAQPAAPPALVWRGREIGYGELRRAARGWLAELDRRGIAAGESVAIDGDYSPGTCALLLAAIALGLVAVPLTPATPGGREELLAVAGVGPVFRFDGDDGWRCERRSDPPTHPLLERLRASGRPGLIVFSSGSTGETKASLHDFERVLAKFERRRRPFRALTFLLLDHLGGLNTLFSILSSGGTVVAGEERGPEAMCQAIERHRVELLPTTPTFLKMLLISGAHERHDLSSLQLISYGTEPMPASTLAELRRALPGVRLKQTYGLSELGVLSTHSRDSDSLWLRVGGEGFETRVVDGTLRIRAASAMLGYLNDRPQPFDAEGWFDTQDVVEVDGDYLRFLGRKSEVINVGGQKVYPAEVESVLMQMGNVCDVLVAGRPNPITGQVVAAAVRLDQPEDADAFEERLRVFCRGRLEPWKVPVVVDMAERDLYNLRFKKARQV
jgi:long-chain acyl-CoA synthetase